MPVDWLHRDIAERVVGVRSGATWVRLRGHRVDTDAPAVVSLHGWSHDLTVAQWLATGATSSTDPIFRSYQYDVLCAAGRTVYLPFLGSNWGTESTTSPSVGGAGLAGVDAAVAQAHADGHTGPIDLMGASAGGHNALMWLLDPDRAALVHRCYLLSPGVDLAAAYDVDTTSYGGLPPIDVSMRAVLGGTDKPSWLPLSAPYDPYRIGGPAWAHVGDRIGVFSCADDPLVPGGHLAEWCDDAGASLLLAPEGGHFLQQFQPDYSDSLPLWWLDLGRFTPHNPYLPGDTP